MSKSKILLTSGALLLSTTAVFAAAPTVELSAGAAKTGQDAVITVTVHPNGTMVAGFIIKFDVSGAEAANVDLPTTNPRTTSPEPGFWDTPSILKDGRVENRYNFSAFTADGSGTNTDPLIFTFKLKVKGAGLTGATLTAVPNASSISDDQGDIVRVAAISTAVINGASRNLGGAMNNTVSVAPGVIAAAAGTNLFLLDPASDTLADKAGWEGGKAIGGTVTGRPAFGAIGGSLAVAVGADNGDVSVFDVASGNSLGKLTGAFSGVGVAPAIDANGNIFVAGKVGAGISVASVGVAGGAATAKNSTPVAGATAATSSPAVFGGTLILGTDQGVFRATVDAAGVITPQVTSGIASAISTSPVVSGGDAFVASADGNVFKINVATGAVQPASAALPGPVSNPFAMGDHVLFGGADGKVHSLKTADLTDTVSDFASNPLVTPVDTGSVVYAGSVDGTLGVVGGATVGIGGTLGSSITVLPSANQIVVNRTDGTVYALPTQ